MKPLKQVNDRELERLLLELPGWTAVYFFDYELISCEHQLPEVKKYAEHMDGHIRVLECDIVENPSIAQLHGVEHAPTLILFRDGSLVKRMEGPYSFNALVDRTIVAMRGRRRRGKK